MTYSIGMKLQLFLALALAGLCSFSEAAPKKKGATNADLGNVLYIGDSITHGYGAPSYRWALHKIFVDNGISYEEIGIEKGNKSGGVEPEIIYIARPFKNLHAAMSSQRAYETSGRLHPENSGRLDGTDIFDWLAIEGKADSDKRKLNAKPDTCFILLGTNDMLSDKEIVEKGGIGKHLPAVQKNLLDKKNGDICVIVSALKQANPKVKVYGLSVPAWGDTATSNNAKDYEAVVKKYNKALSKVFKKDFVDLNQGLVDIACVDKPGKAVANFMNPGDKLHPTLQGDLIMAGLVARTMGIAGRTAGLSRKAGAELGYDAQGLFDSATEKTDVELNGTAVTLKPGKKLVAPWKEGENLIEGFSAEFVPAVGNGPKDGWDKEGKVVLAVGNGVHAGKVVVSECYIMWNNGTILYPLNMSKNREPIRVAWIPGSANQHVNKGFYVWLGDMLIGEGLPDMENKINGIQLESTSAKDEVVNGLAADAAPQAPATKLYVKEGAAIIYDSEVAAPAAQGK